MPEKAESSVVRKPVNSNPGLKVNQIITVSSLQMLFAYSFCGFVYRFCDRRPNNGQKTPPPSLGRFTQAIFVALKLQQVSNMLGNPCDIAATNRTEIAPGLDAPF